MEASEKRDRELQLRKRTKELSANGKMNGVNSSAHQLQEQGPSTKEIIMYIAAAFIIVFAVGLGGFWLLLKYFG